MATKHIVVQGECLSLIARRYGFADWKAIYDHPDNAQLKRERPNPNLLYPGDVVAIPDPQKKSHSLATGKTHRIAVKLPKKVLRLVLRNRDGKPLANQAYTLTFASRPPIEGKKTDGDGKLEADVGIDVRAATLKIGEHELALELGHLNPLADTPDQGLSGIQARLNNLGYGAGAADGILGPRTRAALRLFQADAQLDVTGEPDQATRDRLQREHGC